MLFNSWLFIFFFCVVCCVYFSLNQKYKKLFLLIASYVFYASWNPFFLTLIIFSTLLDYYCGQKIYENNNVLKRKKYLAISVVGNLLVLCFFKYLNFGISSFCGLMSIFGFNLNIDLMTIVLPVGISFYTFQTMTYSIDIYRKKMKPTDNVFDFALFVAFFPQLVAGPIERAQNLLPQFNADIRFHYDRVADGIKLMMWGMFKKIVVADRLAFFVDRVYDSPHEFGGISFMIATLFFSFQIYCDFSGYSDIAIGSAQVLGIKLMDNFKRPYFSQNIEEFWRRWHISLSTWFRDYVYIPLGGNRVPKMRWLCNIYVTFIVSGLWHGANWTFVIWGALHGLYFILFQISDNVRKKVRSFLGLESHVLLLKYFSIAGTFCLVTFTWIFFRANSLTDAWYIVRHIFTDAIYSIAQIGNHAYVKHALLLDYPLGEFLKAIFGIICVIGFHLIQRHGSIRSMLRTRPWFVRWMIYYAFLFGIVYLGVFDQTAFIYFQF